uniref:RNA-directed DNA polymerase, eukaryota, reverse transcriptase zinc-binding domain protein n=1 Tax=Tanacetum cinerariifolium TaxID=118510 RepID=A0A6L2JXZ5_TANCI|nr:RNA-directed DNA polymerase, eukaryota, reverse transcriptase zinc-binding domain protein [Tanacetum cinerariifolium]
MFQKPDMHAQIWKNQRSVLGPAKVKGWKLLESYGVKIITFTTTQLILLVERKYPLTRFTLDQMLNDVRLKVEEESKVTLELLSSISKQSTYAQLDGVVVVEVTQCSTIDFVPGRKVQRVPRASRGSCNFDNARQKQCVEGDTLKIVQSTKVNKKEWSKWKKHGVEFDPKKQTKRIVFKLLNSARKKESEATPALVLSDECLLSKDLSKSLFGRVKQFTSLANIRKALTSMEFNTEGRIAWVDVEGISFKLWSDNTFKRITTKAFWIRAKESPGWVPDFIEENDEEEQNDDGGFNVHESGSCGGDSDVEGVLETIFKESGQKENNLHEEHTDKQDNHSGDPFSIYKLLKKKKDNVQKENNSEHSMKYPLGFTPKEGTDVVGMHAEESRSDNIVNLSDHNAKEVNNTFSGNCPKKNSKEDVSNSVCSGHFKTSMVPRTGGSILSLMDELVKVGQVMGYKMDECMSNMTEIIESQGVKEVNFLALQETKMENMKLFSVKMCWGNFVFDYVHSDSVGNSGGILCVWDPNSFRKSNATAFDYFIMIRGVWRQTGNDLLIITVYAPHDLKDKQLLWAYLTYEIGKWKWEVVIMGDFNEVRYKSDRFGSVFNVQGHNVFNSFITNAGLKETPFRFFHHWIEMEGFSKVVEDAWREGPCDESNAMINMMIKLKYLKTKIREWNKKNMLSAKNIKAKYKDELEALEAIIDKGDGIMVDGMWIESPNRVKDEFFHHFSSRFDKPDARRAHIEMRYSKTLTCDQQVELESDVSNEEIKRAVWDCGIDKSPGPDGFTLGFFRRFWNLIENDMYDVVKYFFTYGVIPKGCNSSFIALIPKIPDTNTVKDLRPISLIGSLYKIIEKILANRLVGVLGDIANEVQSAFTAGRQILDGPFILNEVFQWCKIKKKQSLIFKVDFEKAYDSVRSLRGWIIINGSPTKEFQFFKGLKQGIKLSSSLSISHMFYADDAVFVGQWCDGNITTLVHVLECFNQASGLRINMSKSKIMGVLVDSDKVKCATSKLGCLILKTPFSYLGSKVGGSMSRVHT